ncbi:MAG TPA: type II toxin-antitoxin system PemK/MazF family toxin [Fimbriimonadaceae bacterium]|nr:type II toxin-antitoxin system PemK/MazF family toxin [Fimbriimonadaceae bacterium]
MAIEQGSLFWHDFGPRQDHLHEGRRPVLVVQTDALNRLEGYGNVVVVPLTTKEKKSPTYAKVEPSRANSLAGTSWAIANQIFTIDKKRLTESLGHVSAEEMYQVKEALKVTLAIK